MLDLYGKVAIITGASRGIGQAIAEAYAQAGAAVVLTSRKIENVGPVAEPIRAAGGRAIALAAHAGQEAQTEAVARRPGRVRPCRHPGQQRGHQPPLRPHPDRRRQPLGQDLRGQCQGLFLHDQGRCPGHEGAGRRQDYQRRQHRGHQPRPADGRLQHQQGGRDHADQGAGGRTRPGQHPGQRPRPWLCQDQVLSPAVDQPAI